MLRLRLLLRRLCLLPLRQPPVRPCTTLPHRRALRPPSGGAGEGGEAGEKANRGKTMEYEVACVLEQLCLDVEAWAGLLPTHWPELEGPGAHCALANPDLEEFCLPCELSCMAADVQAIPALLRDPRLVREAQVEAQEIRANEPLRLPSLRIGVALCALTAGTLRAINTERRTSQIV